VFGSKFWADFPYFLPCLVAASFTLGAAILVLVFFKEVGQPANSLPSLQCSFAQTLISHPRNRKPVPPAVVDGEPRETNEQPEPEIKPVPLRALLTRRVVFSVANYCMLAFLDISLACMGPVYYATPIEVRASPLINHLVLVELNAHTQIA